MVGGLGWVVCHALGNLMYVLFAWKVGVVG